MTAGKVLILKHPAVRNALMPKQISAPATAAEALICILLTCFFSISRFVYFFHQDSLLPEHPGMAESKSR
jgi:hypothetical protein